MSFNASMPTPYGWGNNCNRTLLKPEEVREIRQSDDLEAMAKKYNKSLSTIWDINAKRSYTHIPD